MKKRNIMNLPQKEPENIYREFFLLILNNKRPISIWNKVKHEKFMIEIWDLSPELRFNIKAYKHLSM